jgi:hypothetical protein
LAARVVEFFGYAPLDPLGRACAETLRCPFVDSACIKPRHGACSLEQTGGGPVIICPNRLYDNHHSVLGDVAVQAFGAGVRLATAAEISSLKDEDALTGNEVAVFGKYWGSELSIPQPQAPEGEAEVGGFFIDYVLGSKLSTLQIRIASSPKHFSKDAPLWTVEATIPVGRMQG